MPSTEARPLPSLRRNLVASYAGQISTAVVGIIMLPVYVRTMGAESYGLVGFFAMLQSFFLALDLGMTPTLSRELSRFSAGVIEEKQAARMVRAMEWTFCALGLLCALVVGLSAHWAARNWIKAHELSHDEVARSLLLMGGMIGLQWLISLYRAGLTGLERIVVLNITTIFFLLFRTLGSWIAIRHWHASAYGFLAFQLAACLPEVIVFRLLFYRRFSMRSARFWPEFNALKGSRSMAGGMAFLAATWIVVSQSDKLVLSWMLDLKAFAAFSIAVTLAGGINQLAAPMLQAMQPRFVALVAKEQWLEVEDLYRTSKQVMTVGLFGIAGTMACFAEPLLLAWTGNAEVSRRAAEILPLYALGNATASLLALAFSVQFAFGRLRWQLIGSTLFAFLWIPGGFLAARHAGARGTGWVWLVCNAAYLVLWLPYIHSKLLPGLWRRLLARDVLALILVQGAALAAFAWIGLPSTGRVGLLLTIVAISVTTAVIGLLAGNKARHQALELFRLARNPR